MSFLGKSAQVNHGNGYTVLQFENKGERVHCDLEFFFF